MTDMIAQDLQDMHAHPLRTAGALLVTLLVIVGCVVACGGSVLLLMNVVKEVMRWISH